MIRFQVGATMTTRDDVLSVLEVIRELAPRVRDAESLGRLSGDPAMLSVSR